MLSALSTPPTSSPALLLVLPAWRRPPAARSSWAAGASRPKSSDRCPRLAPSSGGQYAPVAFTVEFGLQDLVLDLQPLAVMPKDDRGPDRPASQAEEEGFVDALEGRWAVTVWPVMELSVPSSIRPVQFYVDTASSWSSQEGPGACSAAAESGHRGPGLRPAATSPVPSAGTSPGPDAGTTATNAPTAAGDGPGPLGRRRRRPGRRPAHRHSRRTAHAIATSGVAGDGQAGTALVEAALRRDHASSLLRSWRAG